MNISNYIIITIGVVYNYNMNYTTYQVKFGQLTDSVLTKFDNFDNIV